MTNDNLRTSADSPSASRSTGNRLVWSSAGFVALLGTLAVVAAIAMPVGAFGRGEHGRGHGGAGMGGEFMLWKIDRMLSKIDASDEQRSQIETLLEGTLASLQDARPDRREIHVQMLAALTGDTVDRAALEAVRSEQLARLEDLTRRVTQSLADVAEVLTPEQRVQLAKLVEEHGERHRHEGRHGRERHGRRGQADETL